MLLIRDREELKAHLLRQREMRRSQLINARGQEAIGRIGGVVDGIDVALVALEAWEQSERGNLPAPKDLAPSPRPEAEKKLIVIRRFQCDHFAPGTMGFRNLCSHCNETPKYMARIPSGRRTRLVSLCQEHAVKVSGDVVFED